MSDYLNKPDWLVDLREAVRQLHLALERDDPRISVKATPRKPQRRSVRLRLTAEQIGELVAAFEGGEATRLQLAERYGIGRSSVAKILRESRRK
ncbi:hypothetical protein [Actinokineospora sp. NBRC 105648]|uniref:hypothetical protein n=1 Tax=Actinokineospora sp. NBRC 105648 TaxID=3032206 RepID=UPI0024A072A9|nr:hypothetical protein [Actinokineospora sp. NBRC 105648]GLZ40921.1 hypothetical protein Acsp05_45450 [Actinokineospora sp. NBRC 105648]